jgi:hypothetical protein
MFYSGNRAAIRHKRKNIDSEKKKQKKEMLIAKRKANETLVDRVVPLGKLKKSREK